MIKPCEYRFRNPDNNYCSVLGSDCEYYDNRTCPVHLDKMRRMGRVSDIAKKKLDNLGAEMGVWSR